jgi:hypothetical protein
MADKPEFVDLIKERTRQRWRRPVSPVIADAEHAMTIAKPEFVDLIKDKTPQHRPRPMKPAVVAEPEPVEEKRLSHWPPDRMEQWRLVNLTPWKIKLKSWKFKDWV